MRLENALQQNIGIFYKDFCWANNLFDNLVELYGDRCSKIYNSKNGLRIILKTGDSIKFVYASESARGYRFNKIFLQPGISRELIDNVIYSIVIRSNLMEIYDDEVIIV